MKKLTLIILGLATLTQTAFAIDIEEWQDGKNYKGGSKVTYQSLYYEALWWANAGFKPTEGKPWQEIEAPSPIPVIETDLTYYIPKGDNSVSEDMISEIKGGTPPYSLVITKEPTKGKVTASKTSFTYTSNEPLDKISKFTDSYDIKVKDSKGNESKNTAKIIIKLDSWKSESYYASRIESDIRSISTQNDPNCWLEYWKSQMSEFKASELSAIKYYVRVRGADEVDLSKIQEVESTKNPDNVNRVIKLMPKDKFIKMFPNATTQKEVNGFIPGKVFNYLNFLKAVAVMPGYCGNYKDDPSPYIQEQLEKDPQFADKTAKKFLATTLAHAVQETAGSGNSTTGEWRKTNSGFHSKLAGTFGHVKEYFSSEPKDYHDASGPFSPKGHLNHLTKGNKYYGRGAKQLSYPVNYANTSLLLYGDLRLVKYPNLVEKDILPFLTAITYTLIPKSGNPSMAEVMDGTWSHELETSKAPSSFKGTYNRNFPLTVLIVNGGPECDGRTDTGNDQDDNTKSVANSKTRIDGYIFFSNSEELLDPNVDISKDVVDKNKDHDYYKVNKLKVNTINFGPESYNTLFKRCYYWNAADDSVVDWDSGFQIFGGQAVHDNLKPQNTQTKKISKPNKTHKNKGHKSFL